MSYLPYFNGEVTKDDAYNMDSQAILTLFGQFRDHPDLYNVEPNSRASMEQAVATITTMITGPRKTYLLDVRLNVNYQSTSFALETLYDIIGWIFSVVGTTPAGATKENYFYPFLGVYFMFCRKLISQRKRDPGMVQITYFSQTVGGQVVQRVCLGANMDKPEYPRKEVARKNRTTQMVASGQIKEDEQEYSDVPVAQGQQPPKVGHCAETFPFLFIRSLGTAVTKNTVGGIAGKMDLAFPFDKEVPNPPYVPAQVIPNLESACNNCKFLINNNGWNVQNFNV
ncbi:hypothetical protein L218DRAFT_1046842 [Marasmius fiardii PR-910]|nr:hypothetical protein L218DRAFT_1046842 [Marasmius fiardii PR-910]